MTHPNRPTGMFAFTVVWFGQVVSLFGTAMTQFALTIWAWKLTGSATALALVGFFSFGPTVLFSPITEEGRKGQGSLWKEAAYGFRYILERPSLLGVQLVFFIGNLAASFGFTVLAPMVLVRTNDNSFVLGSVQSAGAIGGVLGVLLLAAWGGPKRRIDGVLLGHVFMGALGQMLMGLAAGPVLWLSSSFFGGLIIPTVNGSNQALWQSKVAPDVQGRVFSVRRMIAQISSPVSMLLAGPLADRFFTPAMMAGGGLAPAFGWMVGVGPGAGMALMLVIGGAVSALAGLAGYAFPAIRNVEARLPDHQALPMPLAGAVD